MIKLNGNSNVKVTPTTEKRGVGVCGETTVNNLPQFLERLFNHFKPNLQEEEYLISKIDMWRERDYQRYFRQHNLPQFLERLFI